MLFPHGLDGEFTATVTLDDLGAAGGVADLQVRLGRLDGQGVERAGALSGAGDRQLRGR